MNGSRDASAFAWRAVAVAVAVGVSVGMGAAAAEMGVSGWLVAGWLAAAVPGVAGGAWLAERWGRPDTGVLVALGASMGFRFLGVAAGLIAALRSGGGEHVPFLLGFGATFVPLLIFEAVWFWRRSTGAVGR